MDSRQQSQMESGDLILADIDWSRTVELLYITVTGRARTSPDEITLFKSNGLRSKT